MATQDTTNAQALSVDTNQTIEISLSAGQNLMLATGDATVQGMTIGDNGALVIHLSNGGTLSVLNYSEIASMSPAPTLTMPNGQKLNLADLDSMASPAADQANASPTDEVLADAKDATVINAPKAGESLVVKLEAGEDYQFGFAMNEPKAVKDNGGQLVITFENGGEIIIPNYGAMKTAGLELTMSDGAALPVSDFGDILASAAQLNQIEAAAGDAGGAGGARNGFGFQSAFNYTPFQSVDPIGPINPTALEYRTTDREPDPTLGPAVNPVLNVKDSLVYEDGTTVIEISAYPNNGNEQITITISGFDTTWSVNTGISGGTYDPVAGTWTITLPPGVPFIGGPAVSPPADSDGDMTGLSVQSTVTNSLTGQTVSVTKTVNVYTDAVADTPDLLASDASGAEDTPIPLHISTAVTDTDGSEEITSVLISGVPAGATLNHGTEVSPGVWQLSVADLTGLTITPPHDWSGTFPLTIVSTATEVNLSDSEFDLTNNQANAQTVIYVEVTPVADPPNFEVQDSQVKEDGSVAVQVSASLNDTDGSEVLTVSISGIQPGWGVDTTASGGTYDAATGTWTLTLPAGVTSFTGGPTLSPPADSDVDLTGLVATATATETGNADAASSTATLNVFVDAVIDAPFVNAGDVTAAEDTPAALNISTGTGETADGSEAITKVVISGVPAGFTLSAGTDLGGGEWQLTQAELSGLTLNPPANWTGDVTLTVTSTAEETALNGTEWDTTDNLATVTDTLTVTFTPQADPPTLKVSDEAIKEDGSGAFHIQATLNDPSEALTITIEGIQPGWGVDTTTSGGTYDASTGTWSLTLPAGQNFSGGPSFTPPADSDVDMTGLVVTATSTDATGGTASSNATIKVVVDAVIDTPTLSANSPGGEEGTSFALNIATATGESLDGSSDGSEAITNITISGLPPGFTLSAGTDLGGGVWSLTPGQLAGLQLNTADGFSGTLNLNVSSTSTEVNLGGDEFDFTDNSMTVYTTVPVNITPDDTPEIVDPGKKTVDETDLSGGVVSTSGTISANFFADGPGAFSPTGVASFGVTGSLAGGVLTSEGHAVTVALTGGNTYTGTANGATVFTLVINADGSYQFNLIGTLDHADKTNPNDAINLQFGITATDSDGDVDTTTLTVRVLDDGVTANDDHNTFNTEDGFTTGNVVTGLNGGPGAADNLSQDDSNTVTKVTFGTTTVDVPETGTVSIDGDYGTLEISADGSYTYTLFPGVGGGTTIIEHDFDGSVGFPVLSEGVKYTGTDALGVLSSDVTVSHPTTAQVTFVSEGAGYSNTMGSYVVDPVTGVISSTSVLFTNGNNISAGDTASFSVPAGGGQLGFFIIADGFTANGGYAGLDFSTGTLAFINTATGNPATINDSAGNIALVFTDASGAQTTLGGAIYHTTPRGGTGDINPDGDIHTVSGAPTSGDTDTLRIGFEDLPNLGDTDYEDFIFDLVINDAVLPNTDCPEDEFIYTLTDGDGDSDTAVLDFECYTPNYVPEIVDPGVKTVDETNLDAGIVSTAGLISANFFADGPGTFSGTGAGSFAATGSVAGGALTSEGHPVSVTLMGGTYVGTANGATVFTLAIQPNGSYEFKLIGTLDHANKTNPNDAIELKFGITATDADGDSDTTTLTVKVLDDGVTANDDHNTFNTEDGFTTGNVVSGLNGGPGAADDLSQDDTNNVTKVSFGTTTVDVPDTGTASIAGDFGTLEIAADGSYTYTLFPGVTAGTTTVSLDPTAADVAGDQTSISKNGITVSIKPPAAGSSVSGLGDMKWHDLGEGAGIGVGSNGSGDNKVWPAGEVLNINPDQPSSSMTITLADIGSNNVGHPLTILVYLQGETTPVEITHNVPNPPPANHLWSITIDSADFGGKQIDSLDVFNKPGDTSVSFMLNNVTSTYGTDCPSDEFVYTLTDGDGDSNTAVLDFECYTPNYVPVIADPARATVDETSLDSGIVSATGVISADFFGDGPGTFMPSGTASFSVSGSVAGGTLTSGGAAIVIALVGNTYVGTANGATVFTLAVQPNGAYDFKLIGTLDHANKTNPNDAIDLKFGITATDNDGDTDTTTLTVRVLDDGVNARDDHNGYNVADGGDSGNVITGLNGGPNSSDDLSQDDVNAVTKVAFGTTTVDVPATGTATITGNFGTLTIAADGTYTYTLLPGSVTGSTGATISDDFTYTLTDGDGDKDTAVLHLDGLVPTVEMPKICACTCDVYVKEDGATILNVGASLTDTHGSEVLTVSVSGFTAGWVVDTTQSGGVFDAISGVWTITLPAGVTSFDSGLLVRPPADTDVDLTGLSVTATATEPSTGASLSASATVNVFVDAVVDVPTLNIQALSPQYWHKDYAHNIPLKISSSVTDTDGSEEVTKVVIKLNNLFTNPAGGYFTLDDMGVSLNKGVEVAPGVWEISVNNGNTSAALDGLAMLVPKGGTAFWPIHQSKVGGHTVNIGVEVYVEDKNLSGTEWDVSDNKTTVIGNLALTFFVTPLVLDLNGDGFNFVTQNEGVLFDMTNDGILDKTSWIDADDGFLVVDKNGDGVINNQSEMFGNTDQHADGFANLAQYDTNGDGKIDANDAGFNDLKIWQDINQDGISQADELYGLDDAGIASISLQTQPGGEGSEDTAVALTGSFTYNDGSEGQIVDALFNVTDGTELDKGATLTGTDGNDVIYGTDKDDLLSGGLGNDTLFGGTGADSFVFLDTAGGVDTIKDFNLAEGDVLDISNILAGFDPLTQALTDYVNVTSDGADTIVQLDISGTGAQFQTIAILEGVSIDLDTLTTNGNLIA